MEKRSLEKTCRQLRKQLRKLPDEPSAAAIHLLRTRAQKISFAAAALFPSGQEASLLPALQPVHKAAGKLRNLDVIAALARFRRSLRPTTAIGWSRGSANAVRRRHASYRLSWLVPANLRAGP